MYNILVVDDEKDIVAALEIYLRSEGYRVLSASNGREALSIAAREDVHLILMDIMMPVMDGLTAMAQLRQTSNVPVILLTAKGEDTDKVLGLNVGADDYITKPFNPVELLARVRSQLRRYLQLGGGQVQTSTLVIGGICLDDNAKTVTVDGDPVALTPKEYDILRFLMRNAGTVFSPNEIYVDLLKKEDMPSPEAREYIAVLDRQSHRLKKLTEDLVEASKASSGALNVELQPTDVNVLLSQIEGEYQERLAACHLTLVTQPPAPGTMIQADSRLLSRVMDNLVSNVCKYAMENTRVYVTAAVRDGQAVISFKNVSRDELNISPDELMERFVRGDASRHSEGSGLGLSIARSLVQLQGGTFALSIDADLFRADIVFPLI